MQELSHRGARNAKRHSHVEIEQQLLKMLNIKHKIIFCSQAETSFYLFLFFYWSLIDLQSHVIFRCTAKWISYTCTYIHSFLDSFPITEYWVEFPVLYSRSLFVIYFICNCVYVSPNLSIHPSPFLPTGYKAVVYIYNPISVL